MALNPDCTVADIETDGETFAWVCGCGSHEGGFASKSQAKADHKAHRFPPVDAVREEAIDRIAEAYDVPRELLEPPTQTASKPLRCQNTSMAGRQRPTQVTGGPFQIVFTSAPDTVDRAPSDPIDAVRRAIASDPCSVLGHRPAYLNRGGIACGVCGTPM